MSLLHTITVLKTIQVTTCYFNNNEPIITVIMDNDYSLQLSIITYY